MPLQLLLNLAEFMARKDLPLAIDIHLLSTVSEKCRSYEKSLHYKEQVFRTSPGSSIEALISVLNKVWI